MGDGQRGVRNCESTVPVLRAASRLRMGGVMRHPLIGSCSVAPKVEQSLATR